MASLHQVLQVKQRFSDPKDTIASLAPDFQKIEVGQPGSPIPFEVKTRGSEAFLLLQGYDLNKAGLTVLLDNQIVGTVNRGSNAGWSTFIVPLPPLGTGKHQLQFAPTSTPDACLIATGIVQWNPADTDIPDPFPTDAETVVLQGWVNLDVQRQLGGSPDGDTIWLLDTEVVRDVRGIGAAVLANPKINMLRQHPLGNIKRLKVRFQGVDTPEIHASGFRQNYGFLAFAKLEELGGASFHGRQSEKKVQLRCSVLKHEGKETILDPNQRTLGYVMVDDLNINVEMVRLGYAFPFLYDSVSADMQQILRDYAEAASRVEAGVWREYTATPVEPLPEVEQPFADFGPVNFPTFWRRWAEYRKTGGTIGPHFVEWLRNQKDKPLAAAPNGARNFSELIDPVTNRLMVKPWEIVFKEE